MKLPNLFNTKNNENGIMKNHAGIETITNVQFRIENTCIKLETNNINLRPSSSKNGFNVGDIIKLFII